MLGERTRHIDAACALILALVEELEETEADAVFAQVLPLLARDAQLEIATRRRLAHGLERILERERAIEQLSAAHARARASGLANLEAELALDLGRATGAGKLRPSSTALAEAAEHESDPERAAALELSLSRLATGDAAVLHARKSLEHAFETVDPDVVADSISHLAELLAERGDLVEAKSLLEQRPPTRDGRAARALYDHIRRTLGQPPPDPPDEPDEPAEPLAPAIRAYFTKPTNLARAIIEGALPGAPQLRAWSSGTLTKPAELDSQAVFGPVRSFWCECGLYRGREYAGMSCHRCGVEIIHAKARRTRVGIVALARPIVHPWYAAAASVVLEMTPAQLLAAPIEQVRAQLDAVDVVSLAARFKQDIITAPKAKLADEAGRRLALVDAFKHAQALFDTTPRSLVIDLVLVPPPDGGFGLAVRTAYARIFDAPDDPNAVAGVFDALARRP